MGQAKTLTEGELNQILAHISFQRHAQRNRAMLLTGLWSGMRVGELARLSIADVLNPDGTVRAEIRLTGEQTKGRHPRTVFLPQKLREELAGYVEFRCAEAASDPLFLTNSGRPFTPNLLAQHFFWLFRQAGISGASSHSMRRSFITNLAAKGVGVRVLASLAGHRQIQVTMAYIDASDEQKRRAVELV